MGGQDGTTSRPVGKDPPRGTQGLHPSLPHTAIPSPPPHLATHLPPSPGGDFLTCLFPFSSCRSGWQPTAAAPSRVCRSPSSLYSSLSDLTLPPLSSPLSNPGSPPHAPRWPPFRRKKEQTKQEIKFAFYSRAPSARGTELPKVSGKESALPPNPLFPLPGLKYPPPPAEIREASGLFAPLSSTCLLLSRGRCRRLCPHGGGGCGRRQSPTPSPLGWQRGGCTASLGRKHGKDGVQSSLPRAERCQLPPEHYSPSPAQGANAAVGLKRKEELSPTTHTPIAQARSSPTSPGEWGLLQKRSIPQSCPVCRE